MKLLYVGACGLALVLFGWANFSVSNEEGVREVSLKKVYEACEKNGGIVRLEIKPPGEQSFAMCKNGKEIIFDLETNKEKK